MDQQERTEQLERHLSADAIATGDRRYVDDARRVHLRVVALAREVTPLTRLRICTGLTTTLHWRLSWRGYATTIPTSYRLALWMALSLGEYAMSADCAPGFPSSEIATYTRRAVRLVPRRASLPGCASGWRRSTPCARWRSSYKLSVAHTARLPCCWPTSRRRISTPRRSSA
jgi:hypothetical protein